MKIRIPKNQFDALKDLIRVCEKHNGEGIILDSNRKPPQFERYPKIKSKTK